jgi:hypothetical protein
VGATSPGYYESLRAREVLSRRQPPGYRRRAASRSRGATAVCPRCGCCSGAPPPSDTLVRTAWYSLRLACCPTLQRRLDACLRGRTRWSLISIDPPSDFRTVLLLEVSLRVPWGACCCAERTEPSEHLLSVTRSETSGRARMWIVSSLTRPLFCAQFNSLKWRIPLLVAVGRRVWR